MRHLSSAALAAALLLSGCGAHPASTLATTPVAPAPAAAAATVTVTANAPADAALAPTVSVSRTADKTEGVHVLATTDLSDQELKADATQAGYTVQDVSAPGVTGYVRRMDGPGYMLEASSDQYGNAHTVTYALTSSDMSTYSWLGDHVNKRVTVKGLFAPNGVITVTYAGSALDLSFLTNWWTKGKLTGQAIGTDGLPLVNCEVKLKSAEGYVFLANSDDQGFFKIANLEAGWYQLFFNKSGYRSQNGMVSIVQRKATDVEGVLGR